MTKPLQSNDRPASPPRDLRSEQAAQHQQQLHDRSVELLNSVELLDQQSNHIKRISRQLQQHLQELSDAIKAEHQQHSGLQ